MKKLFLSSKKSKSDLIRSFVLHKLLWHYNLLPQPNEHKLNQIIIEKQKQNSKEQQQQHKNK